MKPYLKILITLFFFMFTVEAYPSNPMFRTKTVDAPQKATNKQFFHYPGTIQRFMDCINSVQRDINKTLSSSINQIKTGSLSTLLYLILISFIYGLIHAVGPGHGKSVVSSYFLSQQARPGKGLLAGLLIALIHTLSAVIIIGIIYFIFKSAFLMNFEKINLAMRTVSYGLIILIGLYLSLSSVFSLFRKQKHSEQNSQSTEPKSFTAVIISSGIIPCPGAAMILLFAINTDIFYAGLLSVLFMSLGMAVTISLAGIITIVIKKYSILLAEKRSKITNLVHNSTAIISGLLILFIGTVLLLGVL